MLTGTAMLHNRENWLTSFDDGHPADQQTLYANAVWWEQDGDTVGGPQGCLRLGRKVPVRIGYTWVGHPGGGAHPVVAWVECL